MRSSLQAQKDMKASGARLPSDTSSPSYFPISIVLVIAWSVVFFFYTFNVQPPVCSISLTNNRRVPSRTNFDHFLGALSVSYSVLSVKLLPVLSHVLFSCRPSSWPQSLPYSSPRARLLSKKTLCSTQGLSNWTFSVARKGRLHRSRAVTFPATIPLLPTVPGLSLMQILRIHTLLSTQLRNLNP